VAWIIEDYMANDNEIYLAIRSYYDCKISLKYIYNETEIGNPNVSKEAFKTFKSIKILTKILLGYMENDPGYADMRDSVMEHISIIDSEPLDNS
jgi:hypothetical protein